MFKLIQYSIRLLLFSVFLVASPIFLLIAMAFSKSFKEAVNDTVDIVASQLKGETYE